MFFGGNKGKKERKKIVFYILSSICFILIRFSSFRILLGVTAEP